jgi:predicted ATPase
MMKTMGKDRRSSFLSRVLIGLQESSVNVGIADNKMASSLSSSSSLSSAAATTTTNTTTTIKGVRRDRKSKYTPPKLSSSFNTNPESILQKGFKSDEKLVGRKKELLQLSNCYERMMNHQSLEIVVIHGTTGAGKTSLIQSFMKNLPTNVLCVDGKFDQLQSHVPYSALVSASDQLCRKILRQPNCCEIRESIRSFLGPDINLLGNLIPTLLEISLKDTHSIQTNQSRSIGKSFTRFKFVFRSFLRSVASSKNPLVFFIDDLQWADPASLDVLKSIVTDSFAQNIMILCAYREGEIPREILQQYNLAEKSSNKDSKDSAVEIDNYEGNGSLSTAFYNNTLRASPEVTEISLDSLSLDHLNELISCKLGMESSATFSLCQLIWKKTNGNPFYAITFLEMLLRRGLLTPKISDSWSYDESQILRMTNVSENLASILESRIQSLSEQVRSILQIASFIGHEFPTSVLVTIVYEEQDTIATSCTFQHQSKQAITQSITAALKEAVDEGLLEKTRKDDEYKFAHDKIQEILYETLMPDETERQLLHQRIGTLIWDSVKHYEKSQIDDWFIFLATDNLNRASNLVDYSGDRYYLIELNLTAAKRTIQKSAFLLAAEYLRFAIDLVADDSYWEERYDLCLDLYNTAADTEKNIGCYARCSELIRKIHNHARQLHHRSTAFSIEMDALTAQGNIKGSVTLGLSVLQELGIRFPRIINTFVVMKEVMAAKSSLGRRKLKDLLSFPEIKDENTLLSLAIMNAVALNAFIIGDAYKATYAAICLRMFHLTLTRGISRIHSPMAIVAWGSLNAVMGRFDLSLEAERLAFQIIDKYNMDSIRGTTVIISYGANHFWRNKLDSNVRQEFLHAYQLAMNYGDINIAQYGFLNWVVSAIYLDDQLADLHMRTREVVSEMRELDAKCGLMFLLPIWQGVSGNTTIIIIDSS